MKRENKKIAALIKQNYLVEVMDKTAKEFNKKYRVSRVLKHPNGAFAKRLNVSVDLEGNIVGEQI